MTEGLGATKRDFTDPPLDGDQYTYGIVRYELRVARS